MSFSDLLAQIPSLNQTEGEVKSPVTAIEVLLACANWAQSQGILTLDEAKVLYDSKNLLLTSFRPDTETKTNE